MLDSYSEEEQVEVARKLAEKEASRKNVPNHRDKLEQRIQNLLLRKGYSYDIIKQALANIDL